MAKETHQFQAETKKLLDLMIHSIYTNREIFLRELISNASDAIDKLHFESLTNRDLLEGNSDYEIFLIPDEASHTLTISDNGLGMNREELIENLGTIAKSGTKAFLEKLQQAKEGDNDTQKDLIGQFGVGFYSAFMVAEKITVVSRKAGETQAYNGNPQLMVLTLLKNALKIAVVLISLSHFYLNSMVIKLKKTSLTHINYNLL